MTQEQRSVHSTLPFGAAAFLALMVVCCAIPRTACPRRIGFDAVPDKIAFNSAVGYYGASQPLEAGTMCAAEAACVSFDTLGIRHFIALGEMVDSPGACTYIKQACPKYDGYQTLVNMLWNMTAVNGKPVAAAAAAPVIANKGSTAAAAAFCNVTTTCLAWSNKGDVLTLPSAPSPAAAAGSSSTFGGQDAAAAAGISFTAAAEATCVYLKDPCPPRYGYINRKDTRFAPVAALAGARMGALGGAAEAAELCKCNPKCTAWNTAGQVLIGGVKSFESSPGVCTYVKQPCPAVPGYTAHDGVTMPPTNAPNPSQNATSFADLVSQCTADPRCTAFDMLRRTWSTGSATEPTTPFPGMCTYVKVSGLLR